MKKSKIMITITMVGLMMWGAVAMAAEAIRPLTFQETAQYGATDALVIRAADLTCDETNVGQTNTFTISGPCAWEVVGYKLDAPFDTTQVTNAVSSTLTVLMDAVTVIPATQIANDTWKPYKVWRPTAPTVATTTSGPDTNLLTSVSTVTNPYAGVITNGATATLKAIVSAPGAAHKLNKMDSGQARVFLKLLR